MQYHTKIILALFVASLLIVAAPQPTEAATTIFSDTFTEATDTDLDEHTPDTGTGWTQLISNNGASLEILGANDYATPDANGNRGTLYTADTTYASPDYEVSVSTNNIGEWSYTTTLAVRIQDANNMYALRYSNNYMTINKRVDGTWSTIATSGTKPSDSDDVSFSVIGNTLTAEINGTPVVTVDDTDITAAGKAGLGFGYVAVGSDYTGIGVTADDFTVVAEDDVTDPTVRSFSPADDATEVAVDASLSIVFAEAVDAETGDITLYKSDDTEIEAFDVTSDISGSGTTTITFTPSSALAFETSYYVQIDATAFDDATGNSYAGISDETTWTFTTAVLAGRAYIYGPNGWTWAGGDTSVDETEAGDSDDGQQPVVVDDTIDTGASDETVVEDIGGDEPAEQQVQNSGYQLLQDVTSGNWYMLEDGYRRPFIDETVASAYQNGTAGVMTTSDIDITTYPLGAPVLYPAGSLVKFTTGPEVFLVTGDNTLQWIINEAVFYSYGYSFADLYHVADSFWTFYQRGADITE